MRIRTTERSKKLLLSLTAIGCAISTPALAYLEPVTGSIILQMILGGVVGAGAMARLYWHKFTAFFGKKKSSDTGADE